MAGALLWFHRRPKEMKILSYGSDMCMIEMEWFIFGLEGESRKKEHDDDDDDEEKKKSITRKRWKGNY